MGPKRSKLVVTNRAMMTVAVTIYARRSQVDPLFKELKTNLGLGQHQVTKEPSRIENPFGIAIVVYLFPLPARRDGIRPGKPRVFSNCNSTSHGRSFSPRSSIERNYANDGPSSHWPKLYETRHEATQPAGSE